MRRAGFALLERMCIPNFDDPDETYLTRWRLVETPLFGVFLHRMDGPDSRATLHDHPWAFVSLILRGGYIEKRLDPRTRKVTHQRRRFVNVVRRDDAHAIVQLDRFPTWTLVLVGRRRRQWGYWRLIRWGPEWSWTQHDRDKHMQEYERALAIREGKW